MQLLNKTDDKAAYMIYANGKTRALLDYMRAEIYFFSVSNDISIRHTKTHLSGRSEIVLSHSQPCRIDYGTSAPTNNSFT